MRFQSLPDLLFGTHVIGPFCERGEGVSDHFFCCPYSYFPILVRGGREVNENGPMSPSEHFFWMASLTSCRVKGSMIFDQPPLQNIVIHSTFG